MNKHELRVRIARQSELSACCSVVVTAFSTQYYCMGNARCLLYCIGNWYRCWPLCWSQPRLACPARTPVLYLLTLTQYDRRQYSPCTSTTVLYNTTADYYSDIQARLKLKTPAGKAPSPHRNAVVPPAGRLHCRGTTVVVLYYCSGSSAHQQHN